jgi:hypothetical protein
MTPKTAPSSELRQRDRYFNMHGAIQWLAAGMMAQVDGVRRPVCVTAIVGLLIFLAGCKSPAPTEAVVDPNIALVSTAGLRLGMTPAEVQEVSARRLYKEDERNEDRLAGLMQKEKERSTIRLDRVRTLSTRESFTFHSNAVTLTLQFARNRLIQIEERHANLGEADLRKAMKEISTQFPFVINRTETASGAQWEYQGKNPEAYVRIDFRFVSNANPRTAPPMSSYKIVVADPVWGSRREVK